MFFDGSRSRHGAGGGVVLVSPNTMKHYAAFRFGFSCTNNTTEYGSLIQGLEWARERGIGCIKVHGDSELIVNQVRDLHVAKNDILKLYKHRVWDIIEEFFAFNIVSIPRIKNQHADRLAAVGAQFDIPTEISKENIQQHVKIVVRPLVPDNNVS